MFKTFFSKETTKANVVFAVAGALAAIFEATETIKKYKIEQELKKENQ